jgi:hypothetical protein
MMKSLPEEMRREIFRFLDVFAKKNLYMTASEWYEYYVDGHLFYDVMSIKKPRIDFIAKHVRHLNLQIHSPVRCARNDPDLFFRRQKQIDHIVKEAKRYQIRLDTIRYIGPECSTCWKGLAPHRQNLRTLLEPI